MNLNKGSINNLMRVWKLVRGVTGDELRALQSRDVKLAVVGTPANRAWAMARLGESAGVVTEYDDQLQSLTKTKQLVLNADDPALQTDAGWSSALASVAKLKPELRIALGAQVPAFRQVVAEQLAREYSVTNARLAAISALPGIVPMFDWLLPATAAGDMLVLTRNQMTLVLEIAACYGLEPDPRARLTEMIPVVGSAFGWRAIAREALGIVPGGVGVAVKAGVAYAGTYAVGRAASYYYATGGRKLDLSGLFRGSLKGALLKSRNWMTQKSLTGAK